MMERRFDMTDFEQSLKDHADQFVMTPSKRVWNGLYNNLHPGSRWPSITVGVVFLFSLIGIGYLNNSTKLPGNPEPENSSRDINISNKNIDYNLTSDFKSNPQNAFSFWKNPAPDSNGFETNNLVSHFVENRVFSLTDGKEKNELAGLNTNSDTRLNAKVIALQNDQRSPLNNLTEGKALGTNKNTFSKKNLNESEAFGAGSNMVAKVSTAHRPAAVSSAEVAINRVNNGGNFNGNLTSSKISYSGIFSGVQPDFTIGLRSPMSIFPANFTIMPVEFSIGDYETTLDGGDNISQTSEGTASPNKPKTPHKKRNPKISWMYFINPTISNVSFSGNTLQPINRQNLSPIVVQPGQLGKMLYNARIGYAAGTQMSYGFSNKWQFTTGAIVSYSGYNVISNQVHPTFAYLTLKDSHTGVAYSKSYITHYGNGQGQNQISLSNYSLQASIPIGLQYSLWENSDIKVSLASSFAPSFVIKSNAFIISSDGRNYVNDPGLLRPVNLTGNFGTYVTFRSNKMKWIVGPNIRYQMLSSYKTDYPVKEHLVDYGIRIGISR
ncbi:MAG: hypothetical protein ABJA32_06445 [Ginsengibacter sp.]